MSDTQRFAEYVQYFMKIEGFSLQAAVKRAAQEIAKLKKDK